MKKLFFIALFAVTSTATFAANNTIESTVVTTVVGNDVDAMLASYEKYVDKYIATMKKVKAGDPTAMLEYAKLLKQAQDLQKKLDKMKDDMSDAQMARLLKINKKLAKAAQSI